MAWRWITDGDKSGVMFDDAEFYDAKPDGIVMKDRTEIYNALEVRASVWGILYTARNAFAVGTADYRDACATLSDLVKELSKAAEQIEDSITQIGKYFGRDPFTKELKMPERIAMAKRFIMELPTKK